jgi:AcrR family transcriptional regulator
VQVSEVQRARILAAMAHVVAEHGAGSATVSRVVTRAGVSRRTFYELFSGCEDCFQAVFEDTVTRASRIATEAAATAAPGWREQVRAGLAALLVFFDDEPMMGSLLVVDALAAGPRVLERRARVLDALTTIVDRGRSAEAKSGRGTSSSPPPLTAEGVVGAVLSVIHARMLDNERRPLIDLLSPLMGVVVLPYLGRAAAQGELARPAPKIPRAPKTSPAPQRSFGDPLEGLNMRLTYRTLVVLSAIAALGGRGSDPSNRQVAEAAGIHDQGQISKLLSRLERLDLIHNAGAGQPKGEPNAWTLTPRGREVQGALATDRQRETQGPAQRRG